MNTHPKKNKILTICLTLFLLACACNLSLPGAQTQPAPRPGPAVTIQEPAPGAQVAKGDSVLFFATANDKAGVVRLDLWVDSTLVLSQSSPDANGITPLSMNYPLAAVETGTYALIARAYNTQGEFGESVVHYVTVIEPSASTQEYAQYIVQNGDSLESIAAKLGVSVDSILQANPHIQGGQVVPGQVILIPLGPRQPAQAAVPGPAGAQPAGQQDGQNPPAVPTPNRPAPVNQPTIKTINVSVLTSPVYYGQACTIGIEPLTTNVVASIDPANAVKTATLNYAYYGKAGSSNVYSIPMVPIGGADFGATINAGGEAEKYLASDGGWADIWIDVLDTSGKSSTSKTSRVTVIFCANIAQAVVGANLPGILPALLPIQEQLNPSLFPDPMQILNLPDVPVKAPSGLQATSTDGCKVNLTWTDNATDETGYEVYRFDPGAPRSRFIAKLKFNATRYEDNVIQPGKYGYEIIAIKGTGIAPSSIVKVEVKSASNCQLGSGPKRLFFQPTSFTPKDNSIQKAFLLLTLQNFSPIRVPRAGQDYFPVGDWSAAGEWAIPLPETILMKPGDTLKLEVQGNGFSNAGPVNLYSDYKGHTYESLAAPTARGTDWLADAANFTLVYRLWLEDWQWGGKVADPSLPAPTNLKLSTVDPSAHNLKWDYDPKAKALVDGFIVYGTYSCPGGAQQSHYVITKDTKTNSPSDQGLNIYRHKQPAGCACSYQVSAFGRSGESKLSAPTTEQCETSIPQMRLQVTFEKLKIEAWSSALADFRAPTDIALFAGESLRISDKMFLSKASEYDLQKVYFNGSRKNNSIIVPVSAQDSGGSPSFTVSPNFQIGGLCMGAKTVTLTTDWSNFKIVSSCGENCRCIVEGSVKALPPGPGAPNAPAGAVWKNVGNACAENNECASSICESNRCVPDRKGLDGSAACFANDQCLSGVCACVANGKIVPCGPASTAIGFCATGMANGKYCSKNSECASGHCDKAICAPKNGLGQGGDYCHHNDHCANVSCFCPYGQTTSGSCKSDKNRQPFGSCAALHNLLPNGQACTENVFCESQYCTENKCAPRDGTGLSGEYCHHKNQCYSGVCMCTIMPGGFCKDYQNFTPESHPTCAP